MSIEIQKAMSSAWEKDRNTAVSRGRVDDAYELGFIAGYAGGIQTRKDNLQADYRYHQEELKQEWRSLRLQLQQKYALIEKENEYLSKLIADAKMFEAKPFSIIKSEYDDSVLKSFKDFRTYD
jgi:hypothetical protein